MSCYKNGRHPVIDKICTTTFIPNNAFLCEEMNFIVLTGANMSGKSTYLKQLAVLQIMAQMGSYIPAEFASFRIADQILTRMGSNSDIEKNYSTFYATGVVLCSTHFTQLTHLASVYPNVENYHFKVDYVVDESMGCSCNFTHVLTPGPCKEKYYGIKIAEISTMPQSIVSDAKSLLMFGLKKQDMNLIFSTCEENKEKLNL
ncbi:mutS protein homolog 4 [Caerostris extrusa]|uniref:MutS protein homolog 4 n=1 Tax=Caerostris extrusa TaxID=172846 RepID=A0AAV4XZM0_CAEEX|nr:mutS protein homolog 4 [Caerostris extrusa]